MNSTSFWSKGNLTPTSLRKKMNSRRRKKKKKNNMDTNYIYSKIYQSPYDCMQNCDW